MALTQNHLTASMYFAVGYGTEGGKDAFRLSIAGLRNDKDAWGPANISKVAGASGYTIGMLQLDFGQLGLAALGTNKKAGPDQTAYVDAFISNVQAYGAANSNVPQLSGDMSLLRSQLLSHGKNISFISHENRNAIDAYMVSVAGTQWIHQNVDLTLVKLNSEKAFPLVQQYGAHWSDSEQWQAGQALAKLYNQSPKSFQELKLTLVTIERDSNHPLTFVQLNEEIAKIQEISGLIAATKAAEKGRNFEAALKVDGIGVWLESAMEKVMAQDFDPRRIGTEADLKMAIRVASAAKVEAGFDVNGNPSISLLAKSAAKTASYTYTTDTDTIILNRYNGKGKLLGGICYAANPVASDDSAPQALWGYVSDHFDDFVGQLEVSLKLAGQIVHNNQIKDLLALNSELISTYDTASEQIAQWLNDALTEWNELSPQLDHFLSDTGEAFGRLMTSREQALSDAQATIVASLEGLINLPERISDGLQAIGSVSMNEFRDLILKINDWSNQASFAGANANLSLGFLQG